MSDSNAASAASTLAAYNPDIFNALTTPDRAYDYVKSVNGEDALKTVVRDMFIKHNMCEKFGITLLHRHFDMAASEKVVAVGGTSTPWDAASCGDESIGKVTPQAFIFTATNQIVPFEYTFFTDLTVNGANDLAVAASKDFVEELGALLFSLKLEKVLGLRAYPKLPGVHHVEFTVDRANIFVEVDKPVPNSIPTSWFFCSGAVNVCRCQMKCVGYCVKSCHPSSTGHYKHHQGAHDRTHSGNHYSGVALTTSRL